MSITTLGEGIRNPKQLWLTFFVQKTDNTLIQACRGLCVAGVAFFADFSTLLFCAEILHLHYLSSAAAGFAVGLLVNYLLTVSWIFATRALSSKWMEFAVFCVIGIIGLGLTELVMWLMTGVTGIHYVFSKFFATALVFFWNFFVRKTLLFR